MTDKQTTLALLGAFLLAPALLTGCAGGGSDSAESGDGQSSASVAERRAKVGACMRAAGYEFDDVPVGGDSEGFTVPDGVDADAYLEALGQCSEDQGGGSAKPLGGTGPEAEAALAACLTEAGLPDVPENQADTEAWLSGLSEADAQRYDDHIVECSRRASEASE